MRQTDESVDRDDDESWTIKIYARVDTLTKNRDSYVFVSEQLKSGEKTWEASVLIRSERLVASQKGKQVTQDNFTNIQT